MCLQLVLPGEGFFTGIAAELWCLVLGLNVSSEVMLILECSIAFLTGIGFPSVGGSLMPQEMAALSEAGTTGLTGV